KILSNSIKDPEDFVSIYSQAAQIPLLHSCHPLRAHAQYRWQQQAIHNARFQFTGLLQGRGLINVYCAHSPRWNKMLTALPLSSLASVSSRSFSDSVSTLLTATMTSPSRKPARAAGPWALSTRTPPL